jgi:hypothetical protein
MRGLIAFVFVWSLAPVAWAGGSPDLDFGPSGGRGGWAFHDAVPANAHVSRLKIWSDDYLDALQLFYKKADGTEGSFQKHGGNGGKLRTIGISSNTPVLKVFGRCGGWIDSLSITVTGKERAGNEVSTTIFGGGGGHNEGFQYRVPDGYELAGLSGHSDDHVDCLGIILRKIPDTNADTVARTPVADFEIGPSGEYWEDEDNVKAELAIFHDRIPPGAHLSKMMVWSDDNVEAMQLFYKDASGNELPLHKEGGNDGQPTTLIIDDHSPLTSITGRYGESVLSMDVSVKGQATHCGGSGGEVTYRYDIPAGYELSGIMGQSANSKGTLLSVMGITLRKLPEH